MDETIQRVWEAVRAAQGKWLETLGRSVVNEATGLFCEASEAVGPEDCQVIPFPVSELDGLLVAEASRTLARQPPKKGEFRFVVHFNGRLNWVDLPMRELLGGDVN